VYAHIVSVMQSEQLTQCQFEALAARIRPILTYLVRLEGRMEKRGFSNNDRLMQLVREARKAVHDVNLELHYLSCDGIGRSRTDKAESIKKPATT
jgi:hypothetical protein